MKRYIALDIGDVRIGVAKSDIMGIIASPLETINRKKVKSVKRIAEICKDNYANLIVVGIPKSLDGEDKTQAEKVREYIKKLKKEIENLEIIEVDERFSTVIADNILNDIEKKLKATNSNLVEKVEKTLETLKETEKELENLKQKLALFETKSVISGMEEINGVKVLIATFKDKSAEDLRTMIDTIKAENEKAIIVLASTQDKLAFAVGVTKTLTDKIKAGDLVKKLAEITGGKGGGRADFAQAGGKDEEKLLDAFKEVREIIENKLI